VEFGGLFAAPTVMTLAASVSKKAPVFPESYAYLKARGIEIVYGVQRDAANASSIYTGRRVG